MKRLLIIYCLLSITLGVNASVVVTAKAPSVVAVGEQFRLQYQANSTDVENVPQLNHISGFDILYGPATSTSSSMQIINGRTSSSSSTTFTYTLVAQKEGTFILPAITLKIAGRNYVSNRVNVVVKKSGAATGGNQKSSTTNNQQPPTPSRATSSSARLNPSDLYIEVDANKKVVYEQEPVLLSYKVYTNLMLEQLQGKMPDLKGFIAKEVPLPRNKHLSVVTHNGRTCQSTTWSKYVMFPQQSGHLTVPSIPFEGVVCYPNHNIDPVDAFFFGSNALTRVQHTVHAPSLGITVKPLPPKPVNFSGAVGSGFNVSAKIITPAVRENETFVLRVKITGTGNIDLISPPQVDFPSDFETYDSQTKANTKLTEQGMTGNMIIDYLAIPNHVGQFIIPPIQFTYFDLADGKYRTISSGKEIAVNVGKGSPNSFAARQRMRNDDIRNIHHGPLASNSASTFWMKPMFWIIYVLLVGAFVLLYVLFALRLRRNSNTESMNLRKANAKAVARLKRARLYMIAHQSDKFYQEVLSALKHFVADKVAIPLVEVTKERIIESFSSYGVGGELTERFIDLVSEGELHLYGAASGGDEQMKQYYDSALSIISQINPLLKKKKK